MRLGSVELEKLRLARTRFGIACSVDVRVMVLPEPGGPHSISGLWEASHAFRTSTCLQSTAVDSDSGSNNRSMGRWGAAVHDALAGGHRG